MLGDDLFIHGNVLFVVLFDVHLKSLISRNFLVTSSTVPTGGTLAWSEGPGAYVPQKFSGDERLLQRRAHTPWTL